VTRDDLPDGGAGHFARTIRVFRARCPEVRIEVLVPDFKGDQSAIETVLDARADVFNHNIETVKRLFKRSRPNGDYARSLRVLGSARGMDPEMTTKSGAMVGLGETEEDVLALMDDLRRPEVDCQILTLGQYLAPKAKSFPVREYVHPDTYERYRIAGRARGFNHVFAGPFVRSSYNAEEALHAARDARDDRGGERAGDPEGRAFLTPDGSGRNVPVPRGGVIPLRIPRRDRREAVG
ncbi:MAG: lipoyl synthase, partial [Nitrospinota bacterium]|nr:lipoyl synthase [Nitrospinota bacterium]